MKLDKSPYTIYDIRYTEAYTLVELLVGITIILIVFTVGLAGYRDFSRRQTLTSVTKKLKTDLRVIQQFALTGQKPEGVVCTRLDGYSFDRQNSYSYNLVANCSNGDSIIKSVDLPDEVSFVVTSDPTLFKVLGQGTNLAADNLITLTFNATGNTETINIGTGGEIN